MVAERFQSVISQLFQYVSCFSEGHGSLGFEFYLEWLHYVEWFCLFICRELFDVVGQVKMIWLT